MDLLALLSLAKDALVSLTPDALVAAQRHETVVRILRELHLDPESPPADFDACYTHAYVEYGTESKSPAILDYFRLPEVRAAFRQYYKTRAASELLGITEWHHVGDELRLANVDLGAELTGFTVVFDRVAWTTATPMEMMLVRETRDLPERILASLRTILPLAQPVQQSPTPEEKEYQAQLDTADRLRKGGHPVAAKQILGDLVRAIGDRPISNQLRFGLETNLAACNLDLGESEQGIEYLEKALAFAPDNYKAIANAAFAKLLRGNLDAAIELAQRALNKSPEAAQTSAPAIYLDARIRRGEADGIESLIEDRYLDNVNYLRVAAAGFMRLMQYVRAEEMLRRALLNEPDDEMSMLLLAQTLYFHERDEKVKQVFFAPQERNIVTLELGEPLELLNRAISIAEKKGNRKPLLELLAARSGIFGVNGDLDVAIQDCDRVLAEAPDHPMALYNRGLIAHEKRDMERAISCLSAVLKQDHQGLDPYIPLASAYVETGQPALALQVLDQTPPELQSRVQPELFAIRSEAMLKLGDTESVDRAKSKVLMDHPHDALMLESVAHVESLQKQDDSALSHLVQAHESATGRLRDHLALRLAGQYLKRRDFGQAVAFFEKLGNLLGQEPEIARDHVVALYYARHYGKAYRFGQMLRAKGYRDSGLLEILASLSEFRGDPKTSAALYAELAQLNPHKPKYLVSQASAEFRSAEHAKARATLERVKASAMDDPLNLMQVAEMLAILGAWDGVIEMAYRARQLGMNLPEIHHAYFKVFHAYSQNNPKRLEISQVGPDTSVRVQEDQGAPTWISILASFPADRGRDEFSLTDPTAQALLGHAPEDVVQISAGIAPVIYTIKEVQSIYVRAFQETGEKFGTWFPQDQSITAMHVENNDPTPLFRIIAGHSVRVSEVYHDYARGELTLSQFARAVGRDEFDAWAGVISTPGNRIMACRGGRDEQVNMLRVARRSREVTLDISALLTARLLGILDDLLRQFAKLYIAQATLDCVTHHLLNTRVLENADFGVLSFEGGKFNWRESPKAQIADEIRRTEQLLDFLKANVQIVPIDATIPDNIEDERSPYLAHQVSAATLLVAGQTKSALYADDVHLRQVALGIGVPNFWTQPLLRVWADHGVTTVESYYDRVIQLVLAQYYFTSIDAELLKYVIHKHDQQLTPELLALLQTLQGPDAKEDTAVAIAKELIKDAWFQSGFTEQRVLVLIECLNVLTTNRNAWIVVHKLVQALNADLGLQLAQSALREILDNIQAWLREHVDRTKSSVLP